MVTNRKFQTYNGEILSSLSFYIIEGLMQGTVNSPLLFNIYTSMIPPMCHNEHDKTYSTAFADDFIITVADKHPSIIQDKLTKQTDKINKVYKQWNLKINPLKCDTILFRKPFNTIGNKLREEAKNFRITITDDDTAHIIPHKNEVKYLGFYLDELLRLTSHSTKQLVKARTAFRANSRLFYNRDLSHPAKVICYQLIIRPLLTYASPLLWNTSASLMEKYRKFERHCLRACLHTYRLSDSKHFISNRTLYNKANIPRIDNFIIKLTRDYFANLPNIDNQFLNTYQTIPAQNTDMASTGYLPPHSFLYFDKKGLIQNQDNIPIIHHFARHQTNKKLPTDDSSLPALKYSRTIPDRDLHDFKRLSDKYWWLTEDGKHLDELRRRRFQKITSRLIRST